MIRSVPPKKSCVRIEERIAKGWPPLQSPCKFRFPLSPFLFLLPHSFVFIPHSSRSVLTSSPKCPRSEYLAFLIPRIQLVARSIWLLLPEFVRTFCYRRLLNIGKSRYPPEISFAVHRLPLGLYAKRCHRSQHNEPNALRLLEQQAPSVPALRYIDTFQTSAADGGEDWFIMTGLPGFRVHDVLYRMSYTEQDQLADDLCRVLDRIHRISNKTPYAFANVSGGRIIDRAARQRPEGAAPTTTKLT